MKNSVIKKWSCGIAFLALVGIAVIGGTGEVKAEDATESVVGKWCVTGGHSTETVEFFEDGKMLLESADGYSVEGTYEVDTENHTLDFVLTDASTDQKSEDTLYWKINGDHLAMVDSEDPMELNIITAYYTKEDAMKDYDTEDDISGLAARAWTVKSGIDTIEIDGEKYDADKMYFVFGMNLLQIGEPEEIGDPVYTKMMYAPYEYEDGCDKIYFFFNQPFSEETGVKYELKLSDDGLKLVAEDESEIVFEAVEVREAQ